MIVHKWFRIAIVLNNYELTLLSIDVEIIFFNRSNDLFAPLRASARSQARPSASAQKHGVKTNTIRSVTANFKIRAVIGYLTFWHRFKTSNELLIIRNVRNSGFGIRDYEFRLKWLTGFLWIDYLLTIFSSLAYAKNNHNTRKPELRTPNPESRIPNS